MQDVGHFIILSRLTGLASLIPSSGEVADRAQGVWLSLPRSNICLPLILA